MNVKNEQNWICSWRLGTVFFMSVRSLTDWKLKVPETAFISIPRGSFLACKIATEEWLFFNLGTLFFLWWCPDIVVPVRSLHFPEVAFHPIGWHKRIQPMKKNPKRVVGLQQSFLLFRISFRKKWLCSFIVKLKTKPPSLEPAIRPSLASWPGSSWDRKAVTRSQKKKHISEVNVPAKFLFLPWVQQLHGFRPHSYI